MKRWVRLAAAVMVCGPAAIGVDWSTFRRQGFVSDFAKVVDATSRQQLEGYCGAVEKSTGTQIALVTIPSLEGEPPEDVANSIFKAWRDPSAPRDQRVMVLLSVADNRLQILHGSGV